MGLGIELQDERGVTLQSTGDPKNLLWLKPARNEYLLKPFGQWLRVAAASTSSSSVTDVITKCVILFSWYDASVIRSFATEETADLFRRERVRRFQQIERTVFRKLIQHDSAAELGDLASPPANRLEALKGDRRGQYNVRINDQYRICFRWKDGDAYEVEVTDYH